MLSCTSWLAFSTPIPASATARVLEIAAALRISRMIGVPQHQALSGTRSPGVRADIAHSQALRLPSFGMPSLFTASRSLGLDSMMLTGRSSIAGFFAARPHWLLLGRPGGTADGHWGTVLHHHLPCRARLGMPHSLRCSTAAPGRTAGHAPAAGFPTGGIEASHASPTSTVAGDSSHGHAQDPAQSRLAVPSHWSPKPGSTAAHSPDQGGGISEQTLPPEQHILGLSMAPAHNPPGPISETAPPAPSAPSPQHPPPYVTPIQSTPLPDQGSPQPSLARQAPNTSHSASLSPPCTGPAMPAAPRTSRSPPAPAPHLPESKPQASPSTARTPAPPPGSPVPPALPARGVSVSLAAAATSPPSPRAVPTRVVVVGVDPDTRGALAVASWLSQDPSEHVDLTRVQWHMYDVPVVEVELLTKTKDGKTRRRRWLDIIAARKIILQIVERFSGPGQALTRAANQTQYISPWAAAVGQPQPQPLQQQQPGQQQWRHGVLPDTLGAAHPGYGSGSVGELTQQPFAAEAQHYCSKKCCSNEDQSHHVRGSSLGADTGAALAASTAAPAATEVQVDMRAFVEAPPIMPHSCSPRTMAQQLYSVGVWYGLLSMAGFKAATVNAMHWKGDLGLKGLDKNDSRLLARQLIPAKANVLE